MIQPTIRTKDLVAQAKDQSLLGEESPLNFELRPGEVGGIYDPNYAFSLFQVIMGLGRIESGHIEIFGSPLVEEKGETSITWRQLIGFAGARKGLLSNLSLFDNVNLPAKYHGYYKEGQGLEHLAQEQLEELEVPQKLWGLRPHQVSGVVIKKTLLARSVVLNPKVLLLESPFEYFGWQELRLLKDWLEKQRAQKRAILIGSDHIPFLTMSCDWLIEAKKGQMDRNFKANMEPSFVAMAELMKKSGERDEIVSD